MSRTPIKVAVIVGTRPEAIKLAPVVRALEAGGERFEPLLVSTGQHREMLEQVFDVFGLRPHVDLGLMKPGQDLYDVTSGVLLGLRAVLKSNRPDWVVIQGDTTTAFAAALAAYYEKIRVAHVEAGLRSGDRYAPFPEELNRRLTDQLSDLLFAPTEKAREALRSEGFEEGRIHVTGNTVVDAVLSARELVRQQRQAIPGLPESATSRQRVILVTGHRRESFGAIFEGMCRAMLRIANEHEDVAIVYPVHLNPNVDEPVRRILGGHERIHLLHPLQYLEFVALMERAYLILTDSGGVQEEAPSFGKPLLVMRELTERPEGIEAGVARLVGTNENAIFDGASALLRDEALYLKMASGKNPYGDGKASHRIVELLDASTHILAPRVGHLN